MVIVMIVYSIEPTYAVFQHPDAMQVNESLERGFNFAKEHRPPNELYWHFGSTEKHEPRGFVVTKMTGLAVMAAHFALRGERPADAEIQQVLAEESIQVVISIFGNSPGFAQDSYLLLKQGEQVVKPNRIRVDARAREAGYQQGAFVYRAKIVGLFPYERLNLESEASLLVFPGGGGEMSFELDLPHIP